MYLKYPNNNSVQIFSSDLLEKLEKLKKIADVSIEAKNILMPSLVPQTIIVMVTYIKMKNYKSFSK